MPFGTQPGTRVAAKLDITSQLTTYILQALVGALALDLALALIMCSWFIVGWLAIPLVCVVLGFITTVITFRFIHVRGDFAKFVLGNLWGIGLVLGVMIGLRWHEIIMAGVDAVRMELGILAISSLVVLILLLVLPGGWKAVVSIVWIGIAVGVVLFSPKAWEFAWQSFKWLLLPYLWPPTGFAVGLSIVMAKEMLFPNMEWTLNPVSFEELREAGLFSLWMPKLLGGPREPPPVAERVVTVENKSEHGRKYATLPDTDQARAFYRAVKRGEPFAERTASKYGVTRSVFNSAIRDVFLDRGWACWKDDRYPKQGVDLLPEGWENIEHIVLTGTTPSPTD
jgi:hypothetical protein